MNPRHYRCGRNPVLPSSCSFPSCQARPKSSSRIESKRPSAAASSAIARFTSPIGDRSTICCTAPAFGNAQQDAQLRRAIFPRVIGLVVEHTRYDSSRKRRQLNQPAVMLRPGKDPRKNTGNASRVSIPIGTLFRDCAQNSKHRIKC